MIEFKGSHFEREVILWAVRWYVAIAEWLVWSVRGRKPAIRSAFSDWPIS
jgi:hypothetical protein